MGIEGALKVFVGLHSPKPVFVLKGQAVCLGCRALFPVHLMVATGLGRYNRGGKVSAIEAVEDLLCASCKPRSSR